MKLLLFTFVLWAAGYLDRSSKLSLQHTDPVGPVHPVTATDGNCYQALYAQWVTLHPVDVPITHIYQSINQSISLSIYLSLIYLSIWPASPCHLLLSSTASLWWTEWPACWMKRPPRTMHTLPGRPASGLGTGRAEHEPGRQTLCVPMVLGELPFAHNCVFATETLKWSMLNIPVYYCMSQRASKQAQSLWLCLLISSPQKQIICMCLMNFTKHLAAPQTYEPDGLCVCVWVSVGSYLCGCSSRWILKGDVCAVNVQLTKVSCLNICGVFCAINTKKSCQVAKINKKLLYLCPARPSLGHRPDFSD